jgi:hypothetical protein
MSSGRQGRNNNNASRSSGGPQNERGGRDNSAEEIELDTKILQVNNKRYYVDVKQNLRGKFIKISEIGPGNRKSRILLTFPVAAEMRDRLGKLKDVYEKLPPFEAGDEQTTREEIRLASETISSETRRYYLDLKENHRGRILRVTMLTQTQRVQILLPVPNAMNELRNTLEGAISEFATDEELENMSGAKGAAGPMESKSLRGPQRMYYFDVGSNRRGMFLRVSEVRSTYRTALTIPDRQWAKFRDLLSGYVDQLEEAKANLREAEQKSEALRAKHAQEEGSDADETESVEDGPKKDLDISPVKAPCEDTPVED